MAIAFYCSVLNCCWRVTLVAHSADLPRNSPGRAGIKNRNLGTIWARHLHDRSTQWIGVIDWPRKYDYEDR